MQEKRIALSCFSIRKAEIMNWETPSFEEIDMSAEIGSYQGEDDNGL